MPNIISDIILVFMWLYANSPLYFIDKFIEDLPITSDPDTYLTPPQVIRQQGYIAESHTIQTSDGYLLEMHRIPYGRMGKSDEGRYPVLLYHGVFCDSGIWLITEPEKSLAFRLADEGYDVWLGNMRGNTYSKAHVTYNPAQKEFWDFSVHEMAIYDLPACIDYILNQTNHRQLVHIGHSLGGTLFFIMSAVLPEYNEKVLIQINLAPGCPNPHTKTPFFVLLAPIAKPLYNLFEHHGAGSFFEHDVIDEIIDQDICSIPFIGHELCKFILIFGYGGDIRQFNDTLMPELLEKMLSGTSIKTFVKILQYINSGLFEEFDYGVEGNLRQYGSPEPPLYNTNNINKQIRVYYGEADPVIDPIDVKAFYYKLPNPNNTLVKVDDPLFSHMDFLVAKDINKLVYDDLIQYVHNFTDVISISSTLNMVSSVHNEDHQAAITLHSSPETVVSIGDNGSSENITIFLPTGFN